MSEHLTHKSGAGQCCGFFPVQRDDMETALGVSYRVGSLGDIDYTATASRSRDQWEEWSDGRWKERDDRFTIEGRVG